MRPGQRFVLLLSLAVLAAAVPTAVIGQTEEWPIKEFEVINVEPLDIESIDDKQLEAILIRASRLLPGDIEAAGLRTIPSEGDLADALSLMEDMLGNTATQLEQWRFPPPQLEPVITRNGKPVYRTYLLESIKGAGGRYRAPICIPLSTETIITLNASDLLSQFEQKNADGTTQLSVAVTEHALESVSHELFHAVQYATPFYKNAKCGNTVGAWITEGTADAVGFDMFRSLKLPEFLNPDDDVLWGQRNYSERLPIPARQHKHWNFRAYNTSSFWRYLAELYSGGRPGPEAGPVDYGYLADFLSSPSSGQDCIDAGDPCDKEIAALDGWLKGNYGGKGLREHLPKFLAAYVHYGEARGFGMSPESRNERWRNASFENGCMRVDLSPEGVNSDGQPFGKLTYIDEVVIKDTAARCWNIEPEHFDSDLIGIEVEVRLADEHLLSQLVAVRASRQTGEVSIQEAVVEVNQITGEPRARFMFPFQNDEKTPFLLVNVARDAQTTKAIEDMPVTFTALDNYARVTSMSSSPGPSGADVDQPLGVVFDDVQPGVLIRGANTRYKYHPALTDPCVLRVQGLHNAQGDGLSFLMDHEGPIGLGEYPVGTYGGLPDPLPPGQVVAGFGLGFLNQPPAQQLQSFDAVAGTLTVQSISGRLVTGVLELVGENNDADGIAKGWLEPPPNYLPGAVIRVEFGLLMHDPGDPANNSEAYDCLSPEPKGGTSGSGAAPPPGDSDSPGTRETPTDASRAAESSDEGGASRSDSGDTTAEATADATSASTASDGLARPSAAATDALGPGETRWVSVIAEGRADLSFYGSDVDGSAGAGINCYGTNSSASFTLYKGESSQTAKLGLSVITPTGIAEGATGNFHLDQVLYLFGGGMLGWKGPATLEISRHEASPDPGSRRIAGRIVGLSILDPQTKAAIPIHAEFDVNAACAPFSFGG